MLVLTAAARKAKQQVALEAKKDLQKDEMKRKAAAKAKARQAARTQAESVAEKAAAEAERDRKEELRFQKQKKAQVGFFPLFMRFSIGKCRNCPFFRGFTKK